MSTTSSATPLADDAEVNVLELDLAAEEGDWSDVSGWTDDTLSGLSSLDTPEFTDEDSETDPMSGTPGAGTTPAGGGTTAPATTTVTLGGFSFKKRATKVVSQVTDTLRVLHPKADRALLSKEDLLRLHDEITKDQGKKKYAILPLAFDDEDKLEDTYNLDVLNRVTKAHLTKYDCHDCFTIMTLNPNDESDVTGTDDLFDNFANYSVAEVALNNRWLREWLDDPTLDENLMLTYQYFENQVTPEVWSICIENYDTYPPAEQGGPLFYVIMMQTLLSCTEEAGEALVVRLKAFKITSIKGEDIHKYVALVRSAIKRLKYVNQVPENINKIVLKGLQTTSVPAFNEQFSSLEKAQKQTTVLRKPGVKLDLYEVEDFFKLAVSEYVEMLQDNKWTGVTTPGASAFIAGHSSITCFNCGGPHAVPECPKPRDDQRIKANREQYLKNKSKKGNNNGNGKTNASATSSSSKRKPRKFKWRPPEKSENGKRTIDGKPYTYNSDTKRWVPQASGTAAPSSKSQVNLVAAATTDDADTATEPPASRPPTAMDTSTKKKMITVALANASKSINTSLTALADQFLDA